MNSTEEIFATIRALSFGITEDTYFAGVRQGHTLLTRLRDMGLEREQVSQPLYQFHNSLEDGFSRDFIADLLDYVVGWCSPQARIWEDE